MMSGNQDKRVVGSILLSAQFRNQTLLSQGHWAWPLLPRGGECVAFHRERHVSTPLLPGGKAGRGRGVGELRHADHTCPGGMLALPVAGGLLKQRQEQGTPLPGHASWSLHYPHYGGVLLRPTLTLSSLSLSLSCQKKVSFALIPCSLGL